MVGFDGTVYDAVIHGCFIVLNTQNQTYFFCRSSQYKKFLSVQIFETGRQAQGILNPIPALKYRQRPHKMR